MSVTYRTISGLKAQQGAILIVAMLIMVLLAAVGVSLMRSSTQDLKMADASAEKKMIVNMLEGAVDEVIAGTGLSSTISNLTSDIDIESTSFEEVTGTISDRGEYDCKRSFDANSTNVMTSCKYVDISMVSSYGKGGVAQSGVIAGVEQAIINGNQ